MNAKCECQHCHQPFEFDVNDFVKSGETSHRILGQVIDCPSCGRATQIHMPRISARTVPPVPQTGKLSGNPMTWQKWTALAVLIIAVVLAVFLGIHYQGIGDAIGSAFGFAGGAMAVIIGIIIFGLGLILAAFWIIFPWMVYHKLSQIEANTRQTALNTAPK